MSDPRRLCCALVLCGLVLGGVARAGGDEPFLVLENPYPDELISSAFTVEWPIVLNIESIGISQKASDEYLSYAWILDASSRETVWRMDAEQRDRVADSRVFRSAEESIPLPAGTYVVYLWAGSRWGRGVKISGVRNLLNDLADLLSREDPTDELDKYLERCFVSLSVAGDSAPAVKPAVPPEPSGSLVSLVRVENGSRDVQPFRVKRDTRVRVRAQGESYHGDQDLADFAWIADANTDATVWRMKDSESRPAGGAEKNRLCDKTLDLPAGEYLLCYFSDDSHAWNRWNSAPPLDPDAWGVALLPTRGYRDGDLEPVALDALTGSRGILARMIGVGDDEELVEEFTLDRRERLHLTVLGELVGGEFFDFGWIEDRESGHRVWVMEPEECGPAGGGRKNRIFDGEITLDAGRYRAVYVSDGSHSFDGWNSTPPDEPHRWGLTLRRAD